MLAELFSGGIAGIISGVGKGILAPILGYFTTARNDDLAGFQSAALADTDRYKAYLDAYVRTAEIQASQNQWWGARLIVLTLASLVTFHFGYVVLDSTPVWGHAVGTWRVAALPSPLDQWEGSIVLSFFVIVPAAPVLSAVGSWFHRK